MPKLTASSREERRRKILEAAARRFERQGFHATTIPDICEEAGVSTGAVYTWFDSKSAIVAALAEISRAEREALLERWSTPAALAVGLGEVARDLRHSSAARLDVHLWSGALTDATLHELALGSFEHNIESVTTALGGDARGHERRELAALLMATVIGVEVLSALDAPGADAAIEGLRRQLERIGGADE